MEPDAVSSDSSLVTTTVVLEYFRDLQSVMKTQDLELVMEQYTSAPAFLNGIVEGHEATGLLQDHTLVQELVWTLTGFLFTDPCSQLEQRATEWGKQILHRIAESVGTVALVTAIRNVRSHHGIKGLSDKLYGDVVSEVFESTDGARCSANMTALLVALSNGAAYRSSYFKPYIQASLELLLDHGDAVDDRDRHRFCGDVCRSYPDWKSWHLSHVLFENKESAVIEELKQLLSLEQSRSSADLQRHLKGSALVAALIQSCLSRLHNIVCKTLSPGYVIGRCMANSPMFAVVSEALQRLAADDSRSEPASDDDHIGVALFGALHDGLIEKEIWLPTGLTTLSRIGRLVDLTPADRFGHYVHLFRGLCAERESSRNPAVVVDGATCAQCLSGFWLSDCWLRHELKKCLVEAQISSATSAWISALDIPPPKSFLTLLQSVEMSIVNG